MFQQQHLSSLFSLPDSDIARAAMAFTLGASPAAVYNHTVRSYLFARELAVADGFHDRTDYGDELVFFSCILHDLGVTEHASNDERFEVDGADMATAFLREHGLDDAQTKPVWNAIALHTSPGLAHRFGTIEAVTQMGIAADLFGSGRSQLPEGFADRVHDAWPRQDIGYALADLIARQVHDNGAKGAPLTFPHHLHQIIFPGTPAVTFFDAINANGWNDPRHGAST